MLDVLNRALHTHFSYQLSIEALKSICPQLPITNKSESNFKQKYNQLSSGVWLGVAPGASYETKKTPLSVILKILNLILNKPETKNIKLVFLGDKKDQKITRQILSKLNWPNQILNLAGKTSLVETSCALSHIKCLTPF